MHSYDCKNGTTFHFNGDLSGEVLVTRKPNCSDSVGVKMLPEITFDDDVRLSGDDLLEFVADYVRNRRIAKLEDMPACEILGTERPTVRGEVCKLLADVDV